MTHTPRPNAICIAANEHLVIRASTEHGDYTVEMDTGAARTWCEVLAEVMEHDSANRIVRFSWDGPADLDDITEGVALQWLMDNTLLDEDGTVRSYDDLPPFVQAGVEYRTFMGMANGEASDLRSEIAHRRAA